MIKKKKKLIQINKLTYSKNSNPKNCYELLYISRFTARLKTESVALFFVTSLIREFQAVIAL